MKRKKGNGYICALEVFQKICLANSENCATFHTKITEGDSRTHFKCSIPNFLKNSVIGGKKGAEEKITLEAETEQRGEGGSISVPAVILKFLQRKDHRST